MKNEFIENAWPCHVPDRSLDDPFLLFDLTQTIGKIKQEDAWKKGDRNAITLLKNPCMRIVLIALKSPANISFHHCGHLASVQVLEGSVNSQTGNNVTLLKKGGLVTLHKKVEHTLIAKEESVILLTIAVCPPDPI
jgi:quercetin dioxygenase-like cupin family protein